MSSQTAQPAMSPAEIQRQMIDCYNRRDFNAMKNLCHAEYSYTGPDGKEITGGPEVLMGIVQTYSAAFPDSRLDIRVQYSQGDTAIAEIVATGTHEGELFGIPASGSGVRIPICHVLEMRGGKALREREYMDMATMFSQMGMKMPGA